MEISIRIMAKVRVYRLIIFLHIINELFKNESTLKYFSLVQQAFIKSLV